MICQDDEKELDLDVITADVILRSKDHVKDVEQILTASG